MPFRRAVQLRTAAGPPGNPWDIRIVYQPDVKVLKGDTLVATFWVRALEPREGRAYTRFVVERASEPYTKSAEWHVSAGKEWRRVEVPFQMVEDSEGRAWTVQFWVSSGPQVIEIGGLSVMNYGARVPFDSLRLSMYPYEGAEEDAEWRAAALARIEKLRKNDIAVIVRDDDGKPIPQASVRVSLKKHSFGFGTAVAYQPLRASGADGERYRETLRQWFNRTVLENELKWPDWERNRAQALESLDILEHLAVGPVRGHALVWPGFAYLPNDIRNMVNNPEALRNRVANRVTDGAEGVRGRVVEWDVVNEAVTNRDLQRVLGDAEMARWFKLAQATDPRAKLYINDYSILTGGGDDVPQQNAYYELIRYLEKQGAPIDGIGIQAHFEKQLTSPARVLEILDRYAQLGKPIEITEFDVDVADEALQAAYTRDFLIAAFSHRGVKGLLNWGFWEGSHWKPSTALVRKDWTWKPNGEVWRDLIYRQWWTEARGVTAADGIYRTRGFRGEYEITVTVNGQARTITADLSSEGPQYVRLGKAGQARIQEGGVIHAATLQGGPVAPGQMITILGSGLGPAVPVTNAMSDGTLPSFGGDSRVLVDGQPVPLVAAAEDRVTAVLPQALGVSTVIEVEHLGERSNGMRLPVAEAVPGVFAVQGGRGQAAALNYDSEGGTQINSAEKPAAVGSVIGLYMTGAGSTRAAAVAVRFGSVEGRVLQLATPQPGVTEVRVEIPLRAPSGDAVQVAVNAAGIWSPEGVTVAIR
ncbi:MAG: endo-1,4-beta-xylanase [Bryobacterales bacterium]|nr:endo-1,4-beta-xylanase [Bryobacterales bacterium]